MCIVKSSQRRTPTKSQVRSNDGRLHMRKAYVRTSKRYLVASQPSGREDNFASSRDEHKRRATRHSTSVTGEFRDPRFMKRLLPLQADHECSDIVICIVLGDVARAIEVMGHSSGRGAAVRLQRQCMHQHTRPTSRKSALLLHRCAIVSNPRHFERRRSERYFCF